jgi:hypothetical protein
MMNARIQTASVATPQGTKAVAVGRKLPSWIDQFVDATASTDSPVLFRKWAGIFSVAAAMEMRCWLQTSSALYPNLYVFIVGHPGVGKNRILRVAKRYLNEIPEFHFAPTSLTGASLVDNLVASKRFIARLPDPPIEYNNTTITAEELTAFMHKYDDEMVGLLSAFYDPDPYAQKRRGRDIDIKIAHPQVNLISGTTPSNLVSLMPETAWDQGFTSRVILIHSDERIIGDDFAGVKTGMQEDLIHDIKVIGSLTGEFKVTQDYRDAVNNWRALGEPPVINHPKLLHYKTRRRVHLYKLSMVSAADRGNVLLLTKDDFNRAMGWLLEAESYMPDIFTAGSTGTDARAIDEIYHHIQITDKGDGVPEHMITNFARTRIPLHSIMRIVEIMVGSGLIEKKAVDRYGKGWYRCLPR